MEQTEKLYYENERLASFSAEVLSCIEVGNAWDVVLNRTAFYPEGGGQPADQGTLDRWDVLDVQEKDGIVHHLVEKPILPGEKVQGRIDMARRIDYMQQHTADHVLSGVIYKRYGYDNVGFHMSKESTFIDFSGPLSESDLVEMERVANEVIWMDLPVVASWPTAEELKSMAYRCKKRLEGPVRIVTIQGVDTCACCGTHMHSTGEVGTIKIISSAKLRGGVRVEYVAGRRAYRYFDDIQLQNHLNSVALSAHPLHTAEAVRRLLEDREKQQQRIAQLEREHVECVAEKLKGQGDVTVFEEDLDGDSVRRLANAVKETCGGKAMVFSGSDEMGYQYAVAVKEGGDLREWIKDFNAKLNGRGGGREAYFMQGSVKASRADIEAYLCSACNL